MPTRLQSFLNAALICVLLFTSAPGFESAVQNPSDVYRLSMPGKSWSLNIPKWALTEGSERQDGDVRTFGGAREGNKKLKLSPAILYFRMEPAKAPGDAQAISDLAKKKLSKSIVVVPGSVKQMLHNNIPVIRYSIDVNPTLWPQSSIPRSKAFEAYYVKDDIWITVQVIFLDPQKEDEKYFFSLLDSLQIVENVPK